MNTAHLSAKNIVVLEKRTDKALPYTSLIEIKRITTKSNDLMFSNIKINSELKQFLFLGIRIII